MEERYHATTQNVFYPDMSNINKILQWTQNLSAHLRTINSKFIKFPQGTKAPSWQGLLITEASRSHSVTAHSVGLLWTNDRSAAEISA